MNVRTIIVIKRFNMANVIYVMNRFEIEPECFEIEPARSQSFL
jgi:hypothetical protein